MNLASLKSKRVGNRGAVTRLINKITDIIADAGMDRDRKIYELNKKLEDLYSKIKIVESLDSEIVYLLPVTDVEADMTYTGGINAITYDARDSEEFNLKTLMDEKAVDITATNPNHSAPILHSDYQRDNCHGFEPSPQIRPSRIWWKHPTVERILGRFRSKGPSKDTVF